MLEFLFHSHVHIFGKRLLSVCTWSWRFSSLPCLQRYRLALFLGKILANLAKTWVIENLDSITIRFIRQWLDLPISAILSGIILPCNQFFLNLQLPSVKFIQCQTVLRNALRSSKSDNIKSLWKSTSCSMNVQYDSYKNTKQVLKAVRQQHTEKLQSQLTSQGFIISFLLEHSVKSLNSLWSSAQSKLPKNIFNFSIRYLSNTLANRVNLYKWKLSQSSDCHFASALSLFFMLSLAASLILKRAVTHGGITQHYTLSPLRYKV